MADTLNLKYHLQGQINKTSVVQFIISHLPGRRGQECTFFLLNCNTSFNILCVGNLVFIV